MWESIKDEIVQYGTTEVRISADGLLAMEQHERLVIAELPDNVRLCRQVADEPISADELERDGWKISIQNEERGWKVYAHPIAYCYEVIVGPGDDVDVIIDLIEDTASLPACIYMRQLRELVSHFGRQSKL